MSRDAALTLSLGDRGADISPCGRYRYSLWRRWDSAKPDVLWVMLNPSTADADADDQTIRKCVKFARRWGFGGIRVCNLYPWRATDPSDLPRGPEVFGEMPAGHDRNAEALRQASAGAGLVVAAWGANVGPWSSQPTVVMAALLDATVLVHALTVTKGGHPGHPLYVPDATRPFLYRVRGQ